MHKLDLQEAAPPCCCISMPPLHETNNMMRNINIAAADLPSSCAECKPLPLLMPLTEISLAVCSTSNSSQRTNIRLHTDGQLHQHQSLSLEAGALHHLQEHTGAHGKGQLNSQAAALNHPIQQPITLKWLPTKEQPNMHALRAHAGNNYSDTSSERLKQSNIPYHDLPSNSKSPSDTSNTDTQGKLTGLTSAKKGIRNPADHPPSSTTARSISCAQRMMTASTELCMTGWQRFCDLPTPAGKLPAKVSAVHRPIVMLSKTDQQSESAHAPSPSDHEVCLDLNIGPSSRGGSPAASSRKSLQDIHSEERSGFSKWQRPKPKEKHMVQPAQCPCNPGSSLLSEKLDFVSPLRFSLVHNKESTIATYPSTLSGSMYAVASAMSYKCKSMDKSAISTNCSTGSISAVSGPFDPTLPLEPPFLGMWMSESPLHQCSSEEAGVHTHDHKLIPTNMLLQAAFPSEIPIKRRKHTDSYHGTRSPIENIEVVKDEEEKSVPQQLTGKLDVDRLRYQLTLSIPCNTIRCVDMPNVQEKSLVDFLHAKKQHKEHFLDKVVVQEDVYQSHPWHFTSAIAAGEGVTNKGAGSGTAHGGSSLYFCCSTKYTKRGNMTRNRMTREGGRWKQQGMVQPIFYGRGEVEAAHKTYLSYIPRGSASTTATAMDAACCNTSGGSGSGSCTRASFFVNSCLNHPAANYHDDNNHGGKSTHNIDRAGVSSSNSDAAHMQMQSSSNSTGRLKHRHRMIEIALQEDLLLEKRSFQLKVAPKPFLVVCILRNTT